MGTEATTAGSATAGAAFGALVGWGVSAATGLDTGAIVGSLSTLGAFAFGRIFGP